jgi:hypothetical protein
MGVVHELQMLVRVKADANQGGKIQDLGQAWFMTEKLYLMHGDDPYSVVPRGVTGIPGIDFLVDEKTMSQWLLVWNIMGCHLEGSSSAASNQLKYFVDGAGAVFCALAYRPLVVQLDKL